MLQITAKRKFSPVWGHSRRTMSGEASPTYIVRDARPSGKKKNERTMINRVHLQLEKIKDGRGGKYIYIYVYLYVLESVCFLSGFGRISRD